MRALKIFATAVAVLASQGCTRCEGPAREDSTIQTTAPEEATSTRDVPSVTTVDVVVGQGELLAAGKIAKINYEARFADGSLFNSSTKAGYPFSFLYGVRNTSVVKGLDQGMAGMRIGGKRTINVPWHLAFGENGIKNIVPPKADLKFEVELVGMSDYVPPTRLDAAPPPEDAETSAKDAIKDATNAGLKEGSSKAQGKKKRR